MAKINDLKRAIVLDCAGCVHSKDYHFMLDDSRCFSSLNIKFGKENRKGIGSVKVKIQLYFLSKIYTYTLEGWFDHVQLDANFKCITIESDFSSAHLYSINDFKFDGLWHEEEGDVAAVPVIASVEAESDCELKRNSAVK